MVKDTSTRLADLFADAAVPSLGARLRLVASLSWPAIMAQLSSILMEYIDAAMVGSLGAASSASIGIVATTLWLFWGLGGALSTGFSVQVAHRVGAADYTAARDVLRQGMIAVMSLAFILAAVGFCISGPLPGWLGAGKDIHAGATHYFMIVTLSLPFCYMAYLSASMLRCAGNMMVPGLLNVAMCLLDVVFNFFLIFPDHTVWGISVPGAGLGVVGAAIGTGLSQLVVGAAMMWFVLCRSRQLNFKGERLSLRLSAPVLRRAVTISLPIAAERIMMCGAQIITTVIVAPLGTAAIAANAFGITAESLCYMPGYGISDAATTLVGQSIGAGRRDLARSFGKITIWLGVGVMTLMGAVMWMCAPVMMSMFTPDMVVRDLGVEALRIEAFAEPMFAAAIVAYGVMVGAGYTLVPACINLVSIWVARLSLAAVLAPVMGLNGVWLAMCIELCIRGISFLIAFSRGRWLANAAR